ncbi:CBS domain-containing protein [Streptomyces sp. NPDC013953]|uniref:CBS domain-containing protein n=1 Tax=Streptomyces sp. NPDC013953 TaxID=3364868 RepID=UPI0036FA41A6
MTRPPSTVRDAMGPKGPQAGDDMILDLALSVLAAARTGHLVVCDADGRVTGLVSRTQLTAHPAGTRYTDLTRLRDIAHDRGPFTSALTALPVAERAMRGRTQQASVVVDDDGYAVGILAAPHGDAPAEVCRGAGAPAAQLSV